MTTVGTGGALGAKLGCILSSGPTGIGVCLGMFEDPRRGSLSFPLLINCWILLKQLHLPPFIKPVRCRLRLFGIVDLLNAVAESPKYISTDVLRTFRIRLVCGCDVDLSLIVTLTSICKG